MPFKKKEETCKYAEGDYKCSRTAQPGDKYCIFHSKDIEGKKDKFDRAFWDVEFESQKKDDKKKYDFTGFVFPGDISFEERTFEKLADFVGAKFSGGADFSYAKFSGLANFFGTQFSKGAGFWKAQFSGMADFSYAKFSWGAGFVDAQFSGEAEFDGAKFYGEVNFSGSKFSGEKLSGLFTSLRNSGIKRIREGKYKIRDFRFHLSEKIAIDYPVIDRMTKDAWYLDDFKANYPIIYWIWWLLADCGRSFLRWAFFSLGFAIAFAFIYYFGFFRDYPLNFHVVYVSEQYPCLSFLYYSIVTFTTLGFGDIVPNTGWLQFWVAIEVILGYIMMGGLISILANKLARRS